MSKVEWKFLNDMCCIYDGTHQTPKYTNSGVKFVSVENINAPYKSSKYISEDDYSQNYKTKPQKGDVLMTRIGDVGTCAVLDNDEPLAYYVSLALLRPNSQLILSNYVKYILESNIGKRELRKNTLLTAVPLKINLGDVGKIKLPVPSLSEQNRIVGILDTFTASIDNLKEQIAQRRKQYEYYRDQLLDLEGKEGVEMKTCGEFCEVTDYVANGSFATLRENVTYKQEPDYAVLVRTVDLSRGFEGDKIFIDEKAYKFLSKSSLFGGEIIINNIGAGVGQTFRCPYLKERMSLAPNSIMVKTPNNDYFFYWFNSIYGQNAMMKIVTPGAMPKFNKTGFKTILVPIPSLQEQNRIVSILDTFEASISNLEAQLKEREKQYEYYRNKLLTFE